jgi:hypothetical protein
MVLFRTGSDPAVGTRRSTVGASRPAARRVWARGWALEERPAVLAESDVVVDGPVGPRERGHAAVVADVESGPIGRLVGVPVVDFRFQQRVGHPDRSVVD